MYRYLLHPYHCYMEKHAIPRSYNLSKVVPLQWYTLKKKAHKPQVLARTQPGLSRAGKSNRRNPKGKFEIPFTTEGSESVSHALLAIKHDRMIATVVWTPN
jgi:hypothetical protein